MTETDSIEWPRDIWAFAIDRSAHEMSGTYATSVHATVPRWQGDDERDRPVQKYVDSDIYDSADRYWRERVESLEAKLAEAQTVAQINIKQRLHNPSVSEHLAIIIYSAMRFERTEETPDWEVCGNSFAQNEARATAARVIERVRDDLRTLPLTEGGADQ